MFGSRLAILTPISALAECNCSSAERTSGRCSTSLEGRLTGSSCGSCRDESSNFSASFSLGKRPASRASKSRCCANCFSSGGSMACTCASAASCATTSKVAIWPSSYCRFSRSRDWLWILYDLLVASICPRKAASCTAAATTLEVSVR